MKPTLAQPFAQKIKGITAQLSQKVLFPEAGVTSKRKGGADLLAYFLSILRDLCRLASWHRLMEKSYDMTSAALFCFKPLQLCRQISTSAKGEVGCSFDYQHNCKPYI